MMNEHSTMIIDESKHEQVFRAIGLITRTLHDAMRELGVTDGLQAAAHSIPDARARMKYVAQMSGEAAEKVISQVEIGKRRQMELARFADIAEASLKRDPVQAVVTGGVLEFIGQVRESTHSTDALFTEILLAQSFHDLTTQAMDKVLATTIRLENELVKLLIDVSPRDTVEPALGPSGPVIDRNDAAVVTNQEQVDDLLESLGF